MADESTQPEPAGREPAGPELTGRGPAGREPAGPELTGRGPAGPEAAGRELAGRELAGTDLAGVTARLGALLRQAGLPAGPGRCERFAAAVMLVRPRTAHALRLCALATLTSSKDEAAILDRVFRDELGLAESGSWQAGQRAGPDVPGWDPAPPRPAAGASGADRGAGDPGDPGRALADRYLGSVQERLASTDFAELSGTELAQLAELMRQITLAVPTRRSRRQRPRPGGQRVDMRATLRQARRTGGHAFRLARRVPVRRPRRLVVLCDISGSMEPYARAMIQLLYCAAGAADAEVFAFATRLTRLTRALARSLPGPALKRAGHAAPDWHGGTRIGSCLRDFNDGYGRRGMARGAVVVIISDGWDTGPPEALSREMQRLSLVAHRIVWVNPRTKSAAYQPLASGMACAWPHCDAVVSGHSLAAVTELAAAIADPVRRRQAPLLVRPAAAR